MLTHSAKSSVRTKKFKISFFTNPIFIPLLVQKNLDIASFRGTNCRQFLGARGTVSRAGLDKQADGSAAPSPCSYSPVYIPRSAELGLPPAFPFLAHLAPGRAPNTGSRQKQSPRTCVHSRCHRSRTRRIRIATSVACIYDNDSRTEHAVEHVLLQKHPFDVSGTFGHFSGAL